MSISQIIIVHGICSPEEYYDPNIAALSNSHWLPWMQKHVTIRGTLCQTPQMPNPHIENTSYKDWCQVIEQFDIDENTILIGHSAGAGFFLRWLSDNSHIRISQLYLAAPWLDPLRFRGNFLQGDLDPNLQDRVGQIHMFYSTDDEPDIQATVVKVKDSFASVDYSKFEDDLQESRNILGRTYSSIIMHEFHDKGHFCFGDMGGPEFPELLNALPLPKEPIEKLIYESKVYRSTDE